MMKAGQTVFVIRRAQNIIEGVLGDKTTAQGFYTRWGAGHIIYSRTAEYNSVIVHEYNDEDIFCTKEAAKKELFTRRLRYPQVRNAA